MSISATLKRKVSYENDENIKKNLKKKKKIGSF